MSEVQPGNVFKDSDGDIGIRTSEGATYLQLRSRRHDGVPFHIDISELGMLRVSEVYGPLEINIPGSPDSDF